MAPAERVGPPLRVLVADDSDSLRAVVRITTESQDWIVLEATNGAETRALARQHRPDVVLLDLDFGGGEDGLAILGDLRSDAQTADIPVVMLTASDRSRDRAEALARGAAAYLTKPFGPLDLLETLRRVIGDSVSGAGLGLYLVNAGVLTPPQLARALARQRERERAGERVPLGALLVEQGAISEPDLRQALAQQRARTTPEATPTAGVLIVDDDAAIRARLRDLIATEPTLRVLGEAESGDEGLAEARRIHPEIVVLDQEMPGRRGIEVLADLRAMLPETRVVMFTLSRGIRAQALALGAAAVVAKDEPDAVLAEALRRVLRGEPAAAPAPDARARLRGTGRRFPHRAVLVLAAVVGGYLPAFLVAEPALGPSAAVIGVVNVALAGLLLGPELGVVAAIVIDLLTLELWSITGHRPGEAIMQIGGNGVGALLLLLLGAGLGSVRVILARSRGREAVLGHAILAAPTIDGVVEAVRAVAAGDAAALYRLSPDRSQLDLVAASGIDALPPVVAVRPASAVAHCLRELAPAIAADAADMPGDGIRSAAFVPVAQAGGRIVGILALFDHRRDHFRHADLRPLLALAVPAAALVAERAADPTRLARPAEAG